MTKLIEPKNFSECVGRLRSFFLNKGYLEVHTQNRLSILAACEDPETVATYNYNGEIWPLPQTGQMWLEHELLSDTEKAPGFFCVSTSYRQEPSPIDGRHETIFPMFEFEFPGNFEDLKNMEIELCKHLGFPELDIRTYKEWCIEFETDELNNDHERQIHNGMITDFPEFTSPFWNMSRYLGNDGVNMVSRKSDVILGGMETIGSAARSVNRDQMKESFRTISDGGYAQLLYDKFGEYRVRKELDDFLRFRFVPRVGGGIGITRMISAMIQANII